jgi:hypothetical protein
MNTLSMENFYSTLTTDNKEQETPLFEALRTIQELAFGADDLLDGLDEVSGGWRLWF